ncbi:NAD(P)-dependent oxidoreductase [Acetobacter oeni]|uniref:Dihydrofolate reductase n=1 Tax=Acetobacter oeni TaxID=304077 RepID=A0A511XMD6_9PROT|nr:NAD(P)-dependent oxidoreductase [Acetobacter oeni]MBB3883691.1 phosphoglycerate dehydrogenase-like enzyme [Acetobacter oeni]NHO19728.1 glyoxylate reductase (NADP(+)) [Acetobacter oeni]GBR02854.1 D-isomer specific 2-hydroxyacid dehydrogenase NAD-binding protein [Acetobacter oeni LMG 21952]GEN64110.1 dihydrofolate reductase [Acetobacter oeni]
MPQTASVPVLLNQLGDRLGHDLERFQGRLSVVPGRRDGGAPWDVGEADILLTGPSPAWAGAPREVPESWGRGPRWVQIASAGVDGFPEWLLRDRLVTCGRGDAAVPIAEYVLTALLLHEKRIDILRPDGPAAWLETARKLGDNPASGTLEGRRLGLFGFGATGRAIAGRARAFGMRVLALRRTGWSGVEEGVEAASSLEQLVKEADHLVLAAPLTPETRGIIGASVLAVSKPGQHLVNIARGALIDQEALLRALDAGRPGFATLDVTDPEPLPPGHPFYSHPRIRLTPHICWSGPDVRRRFSDRVRENIERYLDGRPLLDIVDPLRGY